MLPPTYATLHFRCLIYAHCDERELDHWVVTERNTPAGKSGVKGVVSCDEEGAPSCKFFVTILARASHFPATVRADSLLVETRMVGIKTCARPNR